VKLRYFILFWMSLSTLVCELAHNDHNLTIDSYYIDFFLLQDAARVPAFT
jgi:hypothetical protein